MKPARILIAENSIALPLVKKALSGYELLEATTLDKAQTLTKEDGIDLFVIGIHFDDSQAMGLIRTIREDSKHKNSPIVVLRVLPTEIESFLRSTMEVMKSVKAISEYLEEPDLGQVRKAVEKHLPEKKLLPN